LGYSCSTNNKGASGGFYPFPTHQGESKELETKEVCRERENERIPYGNGNMEYTLENSTWNIL